MMYAIYDGSGRILQGNQVYDVSVDLEPKMRDLGQTFIKEDRRLVSPDEWYVASETLTERPTMAITQSAKTIRAGTSDASVFLSIPKGARCNVSSGGNGVYNIVMDDEELEISIPVPCVYQVKFSLWPYRDASFEIEAVQP